MNVLGRRVEYEGGAKLADCQLSRRQAAELAGGEVPGGELFAAAADAKVGRSAGEA